MTDTIYIGEMKSLTDRNEGNIFYKDYLINVVFGESFCYLSSNTLDLSSINMYLSKFKTIDINKVLKYVEKELDKNHKQIQFDDYMNLFKKESKKTKFLIDFSKCKISKNNDTSKNKMVNDYIPKELQMTQTEVFNLIKKEIDDVNTNLSNNHYIFVEDDLYNLKIRFRYVDGELGKKLDILQEKQSYNYFELEFKLDDTLYPFYPPKISYCRPNINSDIITSILNLNNFDSNSWNYTISLNTFIESLGKSLEPYFSKYFDTESNLVLSEIDKQLIELGQLCKISSSDINIKLNLLTSLSKNTNSNKKNYWKSGTGYGSGNGKEWNINDFIKKQAETVGDICGQIDILNHLIKTKEDYNKIINSSVFTTYITSQLKGLSILEFSKHVGLYMAIYDIIEDNLHYDKNNKLKILVANSLREFIPDIDMILSSDDDILEANVNLKSRLTSYRILYTKCYQEEENVKVKEVTLDMNDMYKELVKSYQFSEAKISSKHRFYNRKEEPTNSKSIMRVMSELNSLRKNLPNNWDSSILMRIHKSNLNLITFLIIGPKDTPYHNGVYEFHAYFPNNYPDSPPKVLLDTTDGGRVRFNPNLYNCGKVCLSLLGTWSGEKGESWNKDISTFLQVLISIQSLIMVENPYFNEPGYEKSMNTPSGQSRNFDYTDNIRLENIRVAMVGMLKSKNEYSEFIREHFRLKKEEIFSTINQWISESKTKKNQMVKYFELLKEELA